jgi:hypothetical protein
VVAALRIGYMKNGAVAHSYQIHTFFDVIFAIVDPLDSEWIAEHLDRLIEGNAVMLEGGL